MRNFDLDWPYILSLEDFGGRLNLHYTKNKSYDLVL